MSLNDHDITDKDILDLHSPEQLAAFFALRGYATSSAAGAPCPESLCLGTASQHYYAVQYVA